MLETPTLISPNLRGSRSISPTAAEIPGLAKIPNAFLVFGSVAMLGMYATYKGYKMGVENALIRAGYNRN